MPLKALATLLPIAGWSDAQDRAAAVAFTGGTDPVLPTPFRIGVAGAATVAAAGLAAAALWEARTGRRQQVSVDLRQATASLRSGTYMKLGDGELPHRRHAIMGCYPPRTGAGATCTATSPTIARRPWACSAWRRIATRWRARLPPGTPPDLEEAIIAAKAPAAWCARTPNGPVIRRPPPSRPCR